MSAPKIRAQTTQGAGTALLSFEVASIKPNRPGDEHYFVWFTPAKFTTSSPIKRLIAFAYNTMDFRISGGPGWIASETYQVDGKVPDSLVAELQNLPFDQRRERIDLMIQSLLAERFKLQVRHETKELPVYALLVIKNGSKLQEAKPGETYANGGHPGFGAIERGQLKGEGIPLSAPRGMSLVFLLSDQLARPVLDQTGLSGKYDIALHWTPDESPAGMLEDPANVKTGPDNVSQPDSSGPTIFAAIQEQLGLKLESTKGPVDVLVIDHIERPTEN